MGGINPYMYVSCDPRVTDNNTYDAVQQNLQPYRPPNAQYFAYRGLSVDSRTPNLLGIDSTGTVRLRNRFADLTSPRQRELLRLDTPPPASWQPLLEQPLSLMAHTQSFFLSRARLRSHDGNLFYTPQTR